MDFKIYAIDFDGTLCENKWPEIGVPNTQLIEFLKAEQEKGNKLILWTCRVDEKLSDAIRWSAEQGLIFDAVNENLPESKAKFGGDPRKIFAHVYIDDRAEFQFILPFSSEKTWEEQEVELACQSEREGVKKPEDAEYGIACYHSALRAFSSLSRDGHSGMSIQITKSILNRLIDGRTLTPIVDTPDIWEDVTEKFGVIDGKKEYQCRRMSSLFKTVKPDGTVAYTDHNRVNCVNIDNPDVAWSNGLATRFIDKLYPIAMPYYPASKKYTIVREEFLYDKKNGDHDTTAFLYVLTPDGEKVEINRYFKELSGQMVLISKEEYRQRKVEVANRG